MTTLPTSPPPLPGRQPADPLPVSAPALPVALGDAAGQPDAQRQEWVPPPLPDAASGEGEVLVGPPPLPIGYEDQVAPRRTFGVVWGVCAVLVVAATLGVIGRALVRMGPSPAAAGEEAAAAAQPAPSPPLAVVAPDPMASLGEARPPREAFDRATAALREVQGKATEPTRRWAASGAFNVSKVRSAADLDKRIETLDALVKATREARLASEAVLRQLQADLAAAGATNVQRELWAAQWASEVKLEDDRQVALAVEQLLGAGRVQLELLRKQWGQWHLDLSTDRVRFADPAEQERFTRQAKRVGAAEAELNETLRRAKAQAQK